MLRGCGVGDEFMRRRYLAGLANELAVVFGGYSRRVGTGPGMLFPWSSHPQTLSVPFLDLFGIFQDGGLDRVAAI
jgi:hypothetical protein